MNNDIESDFWKEIFRHLQHRNMSRVQQERLSLSDVPLKIQEFKDKNPSENFIVDNQGSYITFEASITENISIRLFIQNQIKASLIQKNGNDSVKICDAKFFNNPFPEVQLLLDNREQYKKDLSDQKTETSKNSVKSKITAELCRALLLKRNIDWEVQVQVNENEITAILTKGTESKNIHLSKENFYEEIKSL